MAAALLLPDSELQAVTEALAPGLRVPVGVPLTEALKLHVEEGVAAAVPELLAVALPVPLPLPVPLGVPEPVGRAEELLLGLAPADRVPVGELDTVELLLLLGVGEPEEVPVTVALLLAVALPVPEEEGVSLGLAPLLRVALGLEL